MGDKLKHHIPLWLKWLGIGLGVVTLLWLRVEDVTLNYVIGLGAVWCAWAGMRFVLRWDRELQLGHYLFGGFVAGVATPSFAILLMIVKGGVHAHGFLDFSNFQLASVLRSTPWLGISGLMMGLIMALVLKRK